MKRPFPTRSAFTVLEVLIASVAGLLVVGGVYVTANCSRILVAKNLAINITATDARNAMDRVQLLVSQSYTTPQYIDSQGAPLPGVLLTPAQAAQSGYVPVYSGTSYLNVTGTGAGITFDRIIGGPYNVAVPSGGISATASSIQLMIDSTAQKSVPVPAAGDKIAIYTTAVLSGTDNLVTTTVASTNLPGSYINYNGNTPATCLTYTVNLASPLITASGTIGIAHQNDSTSTSVTPSAMLLRPTALVITGSSTAPELRLIDGYTKSNGAVTINQNYSVLTREIQPTISTSGTDSTPSGFGLVQAQSSSSSGTFVSVILHVRSQAYDQALANKQRRDFTSFMGVNLLVPLKSSPN